MFILESHTERFRDLEKALAKEKGIKSDVKELLDALVSDGLVKMEKIGISNYYWSFPSEAQRTREKRVHELKTLLQAEQEKQTSMQNIVDTAQSEREDTVADYKSQLTSGPANIFVTNRR